MDFAVSQISGNGFRAGCYFKRVENFEEAVGLGLIYTFDIVLRRTFQLGCEGVGSLWPERCHVEVLEALRGVRQQREVNWDKTTCAREDQEQDYSDQGDYCIYHVHHNLFSLF